MGSFEAIPTHANGVVVVERAPTAKGMISVGIAFGITVTSLVELS